MGDNCSMFCAKDDSLESTIASIGNTPNMSSKNSKNSSNNLDPWAVNVSLGEITVMNQTSSSSYVVKSNISTTVSFFQKTFFSKKL